MRKTPSYKVARVEVLFEEERRASWKMGARSISGREYEYTVHDRNFDRLNSWRFVVQVSSGKGGTIIVQPRQAPGKKVWAGIVRRSIVFVPGNQKEYRDRMYVKLNLADPTGVKTKKGTRRGQRSALPDWFIPLRWRMRLKETVASTRGRDANAQVFVVRPDQHELMIRLFFALKIWTLQKGFVLERD